MGRRVVIVVSFNTILLFTSLLALCTSLTMSINTTRPRTFLITGATDGIGQHTTQKLASDGGYALLVHGRKDPSDSNVKSLIQDLESRGASKVAYLQADLSDLKQVDGLAERAIQQLQLWQSTESPAVPSLDVLINNAGVFDPDVRHSAQGYDNTMAINVLAPFVLTRKLLPSLVHGENARIVHRASPNRVGCPMWMHCLHGDLTTARTTTSNHYHTLHIPHTLTRNLAICFSRFNSLNCLLITNWIVLPVRM